MTRPVPGRRGTGIPLARPSFCALTEGDIGNLAQSSVSGSPISGDEEGPAILTKYTSHKLWSQKWCRAWATSGSSRVRNPRSHSWAVRARRLSTQASMGDEGDSCRQGAAGWGRLHSHSSACPPCYPLPPPKHLSSLTSSEGWGTNPRPRTLRMKRRAFQILLQKWRELKTSETDRCKSPPGTETRECASRRRGHTEGSAPPAPLYPTHPRLGLPRAPWEHSVNLRASVPHSGIP